MALITQSKSLHDVIDEFKSTGANETSKIFHDWWRFQRLPKPQIKTHEVHGEEKTLRWKIMAEEIEE